MELIKRGVNVNEQNKIGESPLFIAVRYSMVNGYNVTDDSSIVKILLDNNADANIRTDCGNTPLHCAVAWANLEAVKLLIDRTNLDLRDSIGRRAVDRETSSEVRVFIEDYVACSDIKEPDC
jgi:ankyrin repeat protein